MKIDSEVNVEIWGSYKMAEVAELLREASERKLRSNQKQLEENWID